MGIVIDDRIGSRHLQELIRDSELSRLEAGDACWIGDDGSLVGVEVKKVPDAVSCMFSGRLADHQLPLMSQLYDFRYLIIEGQYRPDPNSGVLQRWLQFDSKKEVQCGKWIDMMSYQSRERQYLMYSSFESWLSTMEILGGVRVRNTSSTSQTAALLVSLYNWWQRSNHRSFNVMHEFEGNGANLTRPQMLRRMIALLPRVGWQRSGILAGRFKSVKEMVAAKPEKWLIEREIAIGTANKIVEALNGKK